MDFSLKSELFTDNFIFIIFWHLVFKNSHKSKPISKEKIRVGFNLFFFESTVSKTKKKDVEISSYFFFID